MFNLRDFKKFSVMCPRLYHAAELIAQHWWPANDSDTPTLRLVPRHWRRLALTQHHRKHRVPRRSRPTAYCWLYRLYHTHYTTVLRSEHCIPTSSVAPDNNCVRDHLYLILHNTAVTKLTLAVYLITSLISKYLCPFVVKMHLNDKRPPPKMIKLGELTWSDRTWF